MTRLMAVARKQLRAAEDALKATKRLAETMQYGVRLPGIASRVEPSRWCRSTCGPKGNRWTNCTHDSEHWYWFSDASKAMLFKLTFGMAQ
ncbi:hypothetical protein [Roseicella aerolata]|uniref:Uncharacterized protein n=1 Tax=Roseicella aerolata TaxID=2883479 RepID=A0A9X1ILF5_9PROT|nr:hypothetical protein [Roseicella aerolata]MCB4825553.1 hypothetical protein [Roseicella aerolata]